MDCPYCGKDTDVTPVKELHLYLISKATMYSTMDRNGTVQSKIATRWRERLTAFEKLLKKQGDLK